VKTLSVVIPTYNTAAMTLRCVQAVRASNPFEVIVVDDGSSDETAQLLAPVIRLDTNHGFAFAANRGVAEAKGDIILLLNSDTIVETGALQAFINAFDRDEKLGVAGAQLLNEDGTPQWSGGPTPTLLWMIAVITGLGRRFSRNEKKKSDVDWVSGAAMAFRREVWKPLSERYRFYCQDIDFCLRARSEGWDVRILDDARVTHLLGATINASPELLWRDLLTWGRAHYGRAWGFFASAILLPLIAIRKIAAGRERA